MQFLDGTYLFLPGEKRPWLGLGRFAFSWLFIILILVLVGAVSHLDRYYYPLYILIPILLMLIFSISDHFKHYNEKSLISRYKYTFVLVFSLAQLITIIFYMGTNYEYLLLLALPASIILSRMLRFLPKYWMQETGLWIIVFTLATFKIITFA